MTYRSIVNSPDFHACAWQMSSAGYAQVSIISAITREQDFRECTTEEVIRIKEAITEVVKRFF